MRSAVRASLAVVLAVAGCTADPNQPGPAVTIAIDPPAVELSPGASFTFTATVTGSADVEVAWSVVEGTGGTVNAAGRYAAPATEGTYHVRAVAHADPAASATATVSVLQGAGPAVTTSSLPATVHDEAYSATLEAEGGTLPYGWSLTSGVLPVGLSLAPATGVISGAASVVGVHGFTVRVTDGMGRTATRALSISVGAPPAVLTSSLPGGTVGAAYSATLSAQGGIGAHTWSVTVGTLPAGLSLAPASGVISGTPTAAGTSTFTVQVRDSQGRTATRELSISVTAPAVSVSTTSLPPGTVGLPYTATLTAAGGTPGFTWEVAAGLLPSGLTLDAGTGVISGTPEASATFSFTVRVTDAASQTATRALSIAVSVAGTGTAVGGTLTTDTTWTPAGSPYRVTSDLYVAKGAKLTIQPGVTVRFEGHFLMEIRGQLDARGTSAAQRDILFTATDTTVGWNGLRLRGDGYSTQEIPDIGSPQLDQYVQHCVFEYGIKKGGGPDEAGNYANQRGGCLWTYEQQKLHLDGNLFRRCASNDQVTGDFGDNTGAVVMFYNHSATEAVFTENDFEDNWSYGPGGAFAVYHSSPVSANPGVGIRLQGGRFLRNRAEQHPYAFYPFTALDSSATAFGGAAAIFDAAAVLQGVTLGTGADANWPDDYAQAHDSAVTVLP